MNVNNTTNYTSKFTTSSIHLCIKYYKANEWAYIHFHILFALRVIQPPIDLLLLLSWRRKHIFNGRGCGQVVKSVSQSLLLSLQPSCCILQFQQRLLLPWGALESTPHKKRKRRRKQIPPQILSFLFGLPVQSIRQSNHVFHIRFHLRR